MATNVLSEKQVLWLRHTVRCVLLCCKRLKTWPRLNSFVRSFFLSFHQFYAQNLLLFCSFLFFQFENFVLYFTYIYSSMTQFPLLLLLPLLPLPLLLSLALTKRWQQITRVRNLCAKPETKPNGLGNAQIERKR